MAIRNLFSKRLKAAQKAGQDDVYQYDNLPGAFRVQVVHIWQRAIGELPVQSYSFRDGTRTVWDLVERDLAEELGVFALGKDRDAFQRVANHFLTSKTTPECLDAIEAVFGAMEIHVASDRHLASIYTEQRPADAIADLNARFREHGIGYQYTDGQIVRIDSEYVHSQAVQPALRLLSGPGFEGPQQEFLRAHEHYRHGKHKESLNEALKAFESTLKAIFDQRGWPYDAKSTAKPLLEVAFKNDLVPSYLDPAFAGVRAILENAVPTTRNRASGHGQGAIPRTVPDYLAAYVLHVAASNIVLLIEAHRAMP